MRAVMLATVLPLRPDDFMDDAVRETDFRLLQKPGRQQILPMAVGIVRRVRYVMFRHLREIQMLSKQLAEFSA